MLSNEELLGRELRRLVEPLVDAKLKAMGAICIAYGYAAGASSTGADSIVRCDVRIGDAAAAITPAIPVRQGVTIANGQRVRVFKPVGQTGPSWWVELA